MDAFPEAIRRFQRLLENAASTVSGEHRTVVLATADETGRPSARNVILQGVDESGFVFVSDRQSRKGRQMERNPNAALCFYWEEMREQVRIEGAVEIVSDEQSDRYWANRNRERQITSWASNQSEPLCDRATLEQKWQEYHAKFDFGRVPRPPSWVGYRLVPRRIEFWQSGWHRLHEVCCYEKTEDGWHKTMLNP